MNKSTTILAVLLILFGASCSGPTAPEAPPRDRTYLLPRILSFTVKPTEIQSGDIVYLSFSVENTFTVSIGREYVDRTFGPPGWAVFASWNPAPPGIDNLHDHPTKSTTYTLTATNNEGSVTASRTVTIK